MRRKHKLTVRQWLAVDLAVIAALALFAWAGANYPLPGDLNFRRLEEQNFLPHSEILFSQRHGSSVLLGESADRSVYIGLGEDWAVSTFYRGAGETQEYWQVIGPNQYTFTELPDSWLGAWEIGDGAVVIPAGYPLRDEEGRWGWAAVAARLPEDAAAGQLTLTREGKDYTAQGRLLDSGAMYFWFRDRDINTADPTRLWMDDWTTSLGTTWVEGVTYRLQLYDAGGADLLTRSGDMIPS